MFLQDKKAISEIIGYVILISIVLAMSIVVYSFLKTYVPNDIPECPGGVSIFVKDLTCADNTLTFKIKNNGRFSIDGYLIKATNQLDQEIATIDLFEDYSTQEKVSNGIIQEALEPGVETLEQKFELTLSSEEKIYSIEIIPVRDREDDSGRVLVCAGARIKETITCPEP